MVIRVSWQQILSDLLNKLLGCKRKAEWVIYDKDIYSETYSCTEHLTWMVADTTTEIRPYTDSEKCCHIAHRSGRTWSEMPGQAQEVEP